MSHSSAPVSSISAQVASPTLAPKLSLTGVVIFGVSYMAPAAVIATFGVIASLSMGAAPLAYLFATVAMLFTAVSYGTLAREFPSSGSIYTYARRLLGNRVGFLAGWVILLDYLFLPMVAWLLMSLFLSAQFPVMPSWAWGLLVISATTVVNIVGLTLADRLSRVLIVLVVAAVIAVIGFGTVYAAGASHSFSAALLPEGTTIPAVIAGAAVAAYSFLGFDAVSTMSEEVKNPSRNVPRAIIIVVLIGGLAFTVTSLVMQWVHPGAEFGNVEIAGFEVIATIGGPLFSGLVVLAMIVGTLASCIAVQASGSRLMFVMGRDGALPRAFFGRLSPRFRTPVCNILLIATIGMGGQLLTIGDATSLINFGAFLAFAAANVCVLVLWWKKYRSLPVTKSLVGFIIVPILGFAVDIALLTALSPFALAVGVAWLVLGVIWLSFLTRGFRAPVPELSISAPVDLGDPGAKGSRVETAN